MRLPPALQAALGDQYLLEREIARGGMATVYAARDLRHDRQVAIKVLVTDGGASGERFQWEIAELEKKPGAALDGIAAIYAGLGDKENAIRTLERAYREHAFTIVFINVVQMYDSLRGDPRFDKLVAQVGLTARPVRKP